MEKRDLEDNKQSPATGYLDLLDAMLAGRTLGRTDIDKALAIVNAGQTAPYLSEFLSAMSDGRMPGKLTRAVSLFAIEAALQTSAGRKAAGLPPRGRGQHPKFSAAHYEIGSVAENIARDLVLGKLTRPQARQALAEHIGDANTKTLDRLLDDLCKRASRQLWIEEQERFLDGLSDTPK